MRHLKAIAIFIYAFLTACASGPQFTESRPPKEGAVAIYVYRPWTFAAGGAIPPVQLDNSAEGKLENGRYIRFETRPGNHRISIPERFDYVMMLTWPNVNINFPTEPNKIYYVRYSTVGDVKPGPYDTTTTVFRLAFHLVPEDIALKELLKKEE